MSITEQPGCKQRHASSIGCGTEFEASDKLLGVTAPLVTFPPDQRLGSRIRHSCTDRLRKRIFRIAVGLFDCNHSDRLRCDPALKLSLEHDPACPHDIASQTTTLSCFENTVSRRTLLYMATSVYVELNGVPGHSHRPHPRREARKRAVESVRRFLRESGIETS